jgi:mannan endo-1,4-beta-mannosidase
MTLLGIALPEGAGVAHGDLSAAIDRLPALPAMLPIWCTWGAEHDGPPDGSFPVAALDMLRRRGIAPVVFWQPDRDAGEHANVLRGDWDGYIDAWATEARAWGHGVRVRFAHEQNGDWFRWSPGKGTNTAESYIAMWRYVVERVRAIAPNVRFWWCANARPSAAMRLTWPGDGWVDVVGLDGYAWTVPLASVADILGAPLTRLRGLSRRPIIIGEFACTSDGTDTERRRWLRNAMAWLRRKGVAGAIWFDIDMRPAGHPDWSLGATRLAWATEVMR